MLKVVIVGYGEMFTNLIAGTLDANCEIVGVFRSEQIKYTPFVRKVKDILNPSKDYSYIKSYNLPEITAKSINSEKFKNTMLKLNPDIMLVGSWGEKISKEIYSIPKIASINAHPSLLPKYRGPNPYFWTIRNMENSSGISFHLVDNDYDTGAILAQEEIKIFSSDTGKTLKERTVLTARGVVCELLKDLCEDIIIPLTQIEEKASYYSYPSELELDFTKSAEENHALIRAISPWGHAYFYCPDGTCMKVLPLGTNIDINKTYYNTPGTVTNVDSKNKEVYVICGDGKLLRLRVECYGRYNKIFTKSVIKNKIKEGDSVISLD